MKMWRGDVDVSCRNPYAKLFLLPDRRFYPSNFLSPKFLFSFFTPCQNFFLSASAVSGEPKLWPTQTTRGGTRALSTRTCVAMSFVSECLK